MFRLEHRATYEEAETLLSGAHHRSAFIVTL